MIRVAIADDHQLFTDGLRDALDALPDIQVVATAGDVDALVAELRNHHADVALLDLEMPGGGGLEAIRRLKSVNTLVVTMHISPEVVDEAHRLGAKGVLSKSSPLSDLAAAVRAISGGQALPVDPSTRTTMLNEYQRPRLDAGAESLTDREVELLQLLATGVTSTEELAERMFISQKTVKNHLASIFQKLSISDRTQAAIEAIRLGLTRGNRS